MSQIQNDNNKCVRILCATLFIVFTFLYIHYYQADLMCLTQHLCSGGKTHYNRVGGTIIVTSTLFLLQFVVGRLFQRLNLMYALSYIPSILLLTALTSIKPSATTYTFGLWNYGLPISFALYIGLMYALWRFCDVTRFMYHYGLRTLLASNTLCMILFFLFVCSASNTDAKLHLRLKAEQYIMVNDYKSALDIIKEANVNDSSLTMISVYALAHENKIGEELFNYNLTGGSNALLPDGRSTWWNLYSDAKFYNSIGVYFKQKMPAHQYFDFLLRHNKINKRNADYLLATFLLDKDLDSFATYIPVFYNVEKPLPKHYREALLLYTHLRSNPQIIFHSNIMEADFQDFQSLEKKYAQKDLCKNMLHDTYGNTYWFYYFYS